MLISQNFCLKPFTTFGVEVRANEFAVISSVADLHELFEEGFLKKKPLMVLGGGSNVLFTDHFKGLMLSCQIRGKQIVKETDDEVFMRIGSGEYWTSLVDEVVGKGYGGIENLSLIPGKVGAAPIQNIGAYGAEVKKKAIEVFYTSIALYKDKIISWLNAVLLPFLPFPDDHLKSYNHRQFENVPLKNHDC